MATARAGGDVGRTAWQLGQDALVTWRKQRRELPSRSRPRTTPRDLPLLVWLWRHKIAYPALLERQFFGSRKTTHRHLTRLVDLGLIKPVQVRGAGNKFPTCYQVSSRGVRYVAEQSSTATMVADQWKRRGINASNALHDLCTTEVAVHIENIIAARADLQLLMLERRYNRPERQLVFRHDGKRRAVVPDAGLLIRQGSSLTFDAIEVDLGSESGSRWRADKLARYAGWYAHCGPAYLRSLSAAGAVERCYLRLILIAHDPIGGADEKRLAALYAQIMRLPSRWRRRIWLTTGRQLDAVSREARHDARIWYRGDQLDTWLPSFRAHAARVSDPRKHYAFVRELLPSVSPLTLFRPAEQSERNSIDRATLAVAA
jgi:hypothetical protein